MDIEVRREDYLDVDDALKRIGGNVDLYKRLLKRFLDGNDIETLENALSSGITDDAVRAAHSIKGVGANLSLVKVTSISTKLEHEIKDGLDYSANLDELKQVYGVTLKVIAEYVNGS